MDASICNTSENYLKARVIAYYLPQFHPIPENDMWWGKGFTEWTNVGKARPLYRGHYQPRVPADLGYYDLRLPEIREAQAEMARNAGVEGFMYWHYWFGNGKRILERPFSEMLASKKPNFPFCLGWANHSWSNHSWKATTKLKKESVLIKQEYPGVKDIENHFFHLLPAFLDSRYLRISNKPIFLIYDPLAIPDIRLLFDKWNRLAQNNGLSGIYFIGLANGWRSNFQKILNLGFDAVNTNGQWHAESVINGYFIKMIKHKIIQKFGGLLTDKYKYKDIIKNFYSDYERIENFYPTIIPQWDRTPRSGRGASMYTGSHPSLFKEHILEALSRISHKPYENRILFLKSWNEWAECNYVEPDIVYGNGYLDAIKDCIVRSF